MANHLPNVDLPRGGSAPLHSLCIEPLSYPSGAISIRGHHRRHGDSTCCFPLGREGLQVSPRYMLPVRFVFPRAHHLTPADHYQSIKWGLLELVVYRGVAFWRTWRCFCCAACCSQRDEMRLWPSRYVVQGREWHVGVCVCGGWNRREERQHRVLSLTINNIVS